MAWTVEIYEGNGTLMRIMSDALVRAGIDVVAWDADSETPIDLSDVLVVDVDSGLPATVERAEVYQAENRPVVYLGVRTSRERYPGVTWFERPFGRASFVNECRTAYGEESKADFEPEDGSVDSDDAPITRELDYDEALELESKLGLDSGALAGDGEDTEDVISIEDHGSMIMDVSDLRSGGGGRLAGAIASRVVDTEELQEDRLEDVKLFVTRSSTFNQTMPDTPLALESNEADSDNSVATDEIKGGGESAAIPSEISGEYMPLFKSVARMLAESWNNIGLAARTDDRADRIERVINAAIEGGVRAASEELQRIPSGSGFGGSLKALTVIEVLRTVRDRRLRGRLELDVPEGTYAIYLDGLFVEGIDMLSGSEDLVVLDMLHRNGILEDSLYSEFVQGYATGQFLQPASMKMVRENVASEADVMQARRMGMKETVRKLVMARRGNFSFLEIHPGDGQPWPIKGIHQSVDEVLLEILREASVDTGDSQATARTKLVADIARATHLDTAKLTPDEREVLGFFSGKETLADAREKLESADVDRVVDRLKKLELLKRSDPAIQVPVEIAALAGAANTVVSPVPDALSRKEKAQTTDGSLDATTHMKASFDIGPVTDNLASNEVDALLEEALSEVEFDGEIESDFDGEIDEQIVEEIDPESDLEG